jgi:hypothetical protein
MTAAKKIKSEKVTTKKFKALVVADIPDEGMMMITDGFSAKIDPLLKMLPGQDGCNFSGQVIICGVYTGNARSLEKEIHRVLTNEFVDFARIRLVQEESQEIA